MRWKRCVFDPWVRKISWRRKWQPHSNILVLEIPWTEEPGGQQSMGSQRMGRGWVHEHMPWRHRSWVYHSGWVEDKSVENCVVGRTWPQEIFVLIPMSTLLHGAYSLTVLRMWVLGQKASPNILHNLKSIMLLNLLKGKERSPRMEAGSWAATKSTLHGTDVYYEVFHFWSVICSGLSFFFILLQFWTESGKGEMPQ